MSKKILKEMYADSKNLPLFMEDFLEGEEQDINTGMPHIYMGKLKSTYKYIMIIMETKRHFNNIMVIADKGYGSNALIEAIEKNGSSQVIPPKKNRKIQRDYDLYVYKERYLIECFFSKIKHFRRVFSRFDKTADIFIGFLHFVGVLMWLR